MDGPSHLRFVVVCAAYVKKQELLRAALKATAASPWPEHNSRCLTRSSAIAFAFASTEVEACQGVWYSAFQNTCCVVVDARLPPLVHINTWQIP